MKSIVQTALYGLHVILHPFDGFWELKHHKKDTKKAALIIFALTVFSIIAKIQSTHFVFNSVRPEDMNIPVQFVVIIGAMFLWVVLNWSITTLFDGKATMGQIMVTTMYSLIPLILCYIPQAILSHFLTINEGSFLTLLGSVAIIWSLSLAILGNATVQDYTVSKTVIVFFSTVVAIIAVLFLSAVFYSSMEQLFSFFSSIFVEIKYWR